MQRPSSNVKTKEEEKEDMGGECDEEDGRRR